MLNPEICPFCKKENLCQAYLKNNSCWCKDIEIPSKLIELLPPKYRGKACICKSCIEEFKNNEEKFYKKYITNI